MSDTPTALDVALDYIAAGLMVIPIFGPNAKGDRVTDPGKQPKSKKWQQKRLTAEAFASDCGPDDNIGIVTGKASGLICVDCDKRSGGMDWYAAHEDQLGNCVKEFTPRGGVHLYYKYPGGRDFVGSTLGLFKGIDFLADGGKQVVTAPSKLAEGQYAISNGLTLIDVAFEADTPPEWILDAADAAYAAKLAREKEAKAVIVPEGLTLDEPSEVLRAKEILREFPAAIQGQYGDATTWQAAHVGRKHMLSPKVTHSLLLEVYNPRCVPPWSKEGLWEKVKSAYQHGKEPMGVDTLAATFPESPEELAAAMPEPAAEDPDEATAQMRNAFKKPVLCAELLLQGHGIRLKCSKDVVYHYPERDKVWKVYTDTEFKSLVMGDIQARDRKTYSNLKPARVKEIAETMRLILEGQHFEPTENAWLNAAESGKVANCVRLRNGILDIEKGELLPHTPEWFSTTILPYDYDPTAKAPEFERFLTSVWGKDDDIKECLQLWLGYVLLSDVTEQKFALFIGASRAGKGVMSRVMERMIGKQCTVGCTLSTLANEHGLRLLVGKRLVVFGDVMKASGNVGELATERLISIIGMDPQVINPKFIDPYSAVLPVKIAMLCNEFPLYMNNRQALTNRMIPFPFTESFSGREDTKLDERLATEVSGMAGERLRMPKKALVTITDIKRKMDSAVAFAMDCGTVHTCDPWEAETKEKSVETTRAYEAYKSWCEKHGHSKKNMENFISSILEYGEGNVAKARVRRGGQQLTVLANFELTAVSDFDVN
jgi:P4 family phage/plasmid primase-like protien